ncbi:MAG: nascent polypeptide-associated complex protein [Candidatus Diapherotrites archaeon]|nr:nascent polypeptide-associated complex protein [Candidatus Diapherotrites archaeon]
MIPGIPAGINPKQVEMLMRQFGIKTEQINAKRVIFELEDKRLVIENPQVNSIIAQGQKMYQVVGEAKEEGKEGINEGDLNLVMEQSGAAKAKAEKALKEANGNIAEAIVKLKKP